MKFQKRIEKAFGRFIWTFRFFVLLPVFFGLLSAVRFFMIGTYDILAGFQLRFDRNDPEGTITTQIVSYIIGGVDYYLIGIVLLIFSYGIYELFISKIDERFEDDTNILQSESLEELKGKLVQVIAVALIVSLFKQMLNFEVQQASDLVYMGSAIFLISLSSYLLQLNHKPLPEKEKLNQEKFEQERFEQERFEQERFEQRRFGQEKERR
ncbi:MAG: YqhA family protein [Phormidesmis sp.]